MAWTAGNARPASGPRRYSLCAWLGLFVAALGLTANAEVVVAPAPEVSTTPPATEQMQNSGARVLAPLEPTASTPQWGPLFQRGVVTVRPRLFYRLLYGNGIQASPGQQRTTTINEISPGILFGIGDRWTLDYSPTWNFYSNRAFQDTVNHIVRLAGSAAYENWDFGLTDSFMRTTSPLIETGRQTKQENSSTNLSAQCSVNSNVAIELTAAQQLRRVWGLPNSYEWSTMDWLHYQFSPQLDAAVGLGFGYVDVTVGPNMSYERLLGRIDWRATDKIRLQFSGGGEVRHFRGSDTGDLTNPIMSASVQYRPAEYTQLNLGASREVGVSYFRSQVTESTRWNAGLEQRLLQEFFLSAGFAQGKTQYVATENGVVAGRSDRYYSFNVRLRTTWRERGTVAILYQNSHNTSNDSGFGFSSNQVGLEIGYRF